MFFFGLNNNKKVEEVFSTRTLLSPRVLETLRRLAHSGESTEDCKQCKEHRNR